VAGVVTALETHHGGGALGQQIDNLALALIAPLGADDYDILSHSFSIFHLKIKNTATESTEITELMQ